ncbi:hypothetical protein [Oceanobacillus caeni]|uniref:hypothetical protein n=1 Tax=Oceanobacillus caeni TaxID=405946 RepID=UPI003644F7F3
MSDLFNNYEESIQLSHQHSFQILNHLKIIISTLENMENPEELTKEVYRDSIIKKYEMLED